jgi:hypothetical protein
VGEMTHHTMSVCVPNCSSQHMVYRLTGQQQATLPFMISDKKIITFFR